jgi:hypothetical protein
MLLERNKETLAASRLIGYDLLKTC